MKMSTDDRFQRMMAKKRNDTKVEQIIGRCSYRRYDEQIHVLHQQTKNFICWDTWIRATNVQVLWRPAPSLSKNVGSFFFFVMYCSSTHVLFMTCMHSTCMYVCMYTYMYTRSIKTDTCTCTYYLLVCVHF